MIARRGRRRLRTVRDDESGVTAVEYAVIAAVVVVAVAAASGPIGGTLSASVGAVAGLMALGSP
jgi:Flp pilus assembly pilin Flp